MSAAPRWSVFWRDDADKHAQLRQAGAGGFRLYHEGLCYLARLRREHGFIEDVAVAKMDARVYAKNLVRVGLWERAASGYRVPPIAVVHWGAAPPNDDEGAA
jgi:hypothetical protein